MDVHAASFTERVEFKAHQCTLNMGLPNTSRDLSEESTTFDTLTIFSEAASNT